MPGLDGTRGIETGLRAQVWAAAEKAEGGLVPLSSFALAAAVAGAPSSRLQEAFRVFDKVRCGPPPRAPREWGLGGVPAPCDWAPEYDILG